MARSWGPLRSRCGCGGGRCGCWRTRQRCRGELRPVADTVLLIDDEPDVVRAVGAYLERTGAEVTRAVTAEEGMQAYERVRPDVVILDLHLPDAHGLDVLERLKGQGAAVILLTGNGDIETAVKAMQLGAENFLTKPVDMTHLAAAAARVAEKVRLRRQTALLRAREHLGERVETLGVSPGMQELERQGELLAAGGRAPAPLTAGGGGGGGVGGARGAWRWP